MSGELTGGCAALVMSAMMTVAAGRWAIPRLGAAGWRQPVRHADCPPLHPLQARKQGTPSMGGVFVLASALVVAVLAGGMRHPAAWLVVAAIVGFGAIGLVDDVLKLRGDNARGLPSRTKFFLALSLAAVIGWVLPGEQLGVRLVAVPWAGAWWEPGWLWVPFAMCVIAGCAHAVNLTDGMDGLAAGLLALAFVAVGALALVRAPLAAEPSAWVVWRWCASLAGACLGFLWFNAPPASVFMGDIGALGLGAALGTLAVMAQAGLVLVIIGGVFVAEAASVMLQVASFQWRKRRIFRVAPLHHHFQVGGLPETALVIRFWIAGAVLGAVGVVSMVQP
jgi:phospho-N-acetylmuramoyl-pentapeptide-transferase